MACGWGAHDTKTCITFPVSLLNVCISWDARGVLVVCFLEHLLLQVCSHLQRITKMSQTSTRMQTEDCWVCTQSGLNSLAMFTSHNQGDLSPPALPKLVILSSAIMHPGMQVQQAYDIQRWDSQRVITACQMIMSQRDKKKTKKTPGFCAKCDCFIASFPVNLIWNTRSFP